MRHFAPLSMAIVLAAVCAPGASARVLRVGSLHGVSGQYRSIQAAVEAARAGDWILVGPGDYKERADHRRHRGPQPADTPAGLVITKAGIHLRGMSRNAVVVDGTRPGSSRCSARRADQDFGPRGRRGQARLGRNGILVWKARNVWVQNLTVCNFLGGSGNVGNEIWWNGGDGSYRVGGHGYLGTSLSTTSTFFAGERTAAKYGLLTSNWSGGRWDRVYASNLNDSGFYIGACQQVCDQTVDHAHGQYNALGYSGSNSGGQLVVENSEFDHNKEGVDTNSQNGDNPPPQNGACRQGGVSPITHTHSCWVFMHNFVHDNNNPNVPYLGLAGSGPVGTGMSVSGGRNDTIMENRFVNNGAWGVIFVPFLDSGGPCIGGTRGALGKGSCLYDEWGDALVGNTFTHNGFYGHPSNGDIAELNVQGGHPTDCYRANHDGAGALTSSPLELEQAHPACDGAPAAANLTPTFLDEVLCNSEVEPSPGVPSPCPTGQYPRRKRVILHRLPRQATMPDPCQGVPVNAWCPVRRRGRR